jgi:sugar phosphate isomerase/epimerase
VVSLKIAIMLGNLKMEPYEGMKRIAEMGVPGVHLSVDGGAFAPEKLDKTARRKLLERVRGLGLEISAVSAWGGDVDLCESEGAEENIRRAKRVIDLSVDLDSRIWQAHVGVMPRDNTNPRWANLLRNISEISKYAENAGACLALETGPEPPIVVKTLIEAVGSKGLKVNYDPANLILWPALLAEGAGRGYQRENAVREFMPVEGVRVLGKYIVHTHAKDAIVTPDGKPKEVPLGQGWIDWPKYVRYLKEEGFKGYYAIERETGEDPVGDITKAVAFLRSL